MNNQELTKTIVKIAEEYKTKYKVEYDAEFFLLKLQEELGELVQAHLSLSGRGRSRSESKEEAKQQVAEELSDVFCYVLLLAHELDVDIETAVRDKWFKYLKEDA